MFSNLYWTVLAALLLVAAAQLQDDLQILHSADQQDDHPSLPFVFNYQGLGLTTSGWICCSTPPSAICIKSQRAQDCPACAPCLPPMSSHGKLNLPYIPPPTNSHNYFRGQPNCKGVCHFEAAHAQPSSTSGSSETDLYKQQLLNKRPPSPIRPPKRPSWPGPPLPPRNRPRPQPPRPPQQGGK